VYYGSSALPALVTTFSKMFARFKKSASNLGDAQGFLYVTHAEYGVCRLLGYLSDCVMQIFNNLGNRESWQ
jgi:hypothetical protein